ncbi:MAG: efflux RND transporter periplasmic adaptor subunit [Deltaproteobacteria bacterium]|nr:efflux RND transporter periplasmic adaptor subunit [Deltaproteobacteria bacterium]
MTSEETLPSADGQLYAGFPRRVRIAALVAALLLSGLAVWAAARLFTRKAPPPVAVAPGVTLQGDALALAADAPQWKLIKLCLARTAGARQTDPLPARVRIDETRAARVGSPLAGRMTRVLVELGQRVKKGAPLFAVSSPELAGLKADRARAEMDLSLAKSNLDRVRAMVTARAVPAKDEVMATQKVRQAELSVSLARAKLASLRVAPSGENEFVAMATRDGVVVEKNVLPGQEVGPDTAKPLIMIADLDAVWVVADLPEADAMEIETGSEAWLTSPSLPLARLRATVEMVSSVVDPERHTVPIRARLENRRHQLRPNMYAQVTFTLKAQAGIVELPASAIVSDGASQYVYVQPSRGRFEKRKVVAGSARAGLVPVLSGLKAGETVVEEGAVLLDNQLALMR